MPIPLNANICQLRKIHIYARLLEELHKTLIIQDMHTSLRSQKKYWRLRDIYQLMDWGALLDARIPEKQPVFVLELPCHFLDELTRISHWGIIRERHVSDSIGSNGGGHIGAHDTGIVVCEGSLVGFDGDMAFHERWAAVGGEEGGGAAGGVGDEECGADYLEEGAGGCAGDVFLAGIELEGEEAGVEVVEGRVAF